MRSGWRPLSASPEPPQCGTPLYSSPLWLSQNMYGQPMPYGNIPMAPPFGYVPASPTQAGLEAMVVGGAMYGAYPPPPGIPMLMAPHMMQASAAQLRGVQG